MIQAQSTFDYQSEFTSEGFRDSEIFLRARDRRRSNKQCLVGPNPTIRFWNDRVVIFASEEFNASVRHISFPVGDAVRLTARAGDQLYLKKTGSGGMALSLLRKQELILALGAVTAVPLGHNVQITTGPCEKWERKICETWLEFRIADESLKLREREVTTIGNYQVYLERAWEPGVPGTNECVSVCVTGDSAVELAAMRGAILILNGIRRITRWDCTEEVGQI